MQRVFFIFLALSAIALTTACASTHTFESATHPVRIALESEPIMLDPRLAVDAYSSKINELLYRGLFYYTDDLILTPDLLDQYDIKSPTSFSFTLKKNLRFADGTPLTAKDVVYTYAWIRDPKNKSPHRDGFALIQSMTVYSDLRFDIELKEPSAPFLNRLTLGIVPEHLGDTTGFSERPIGSGPYRFVVWKRGQFLKMTPYHASTTHPVNPPYPPSTQGDIARDSIDETSPKLPIEFWFLPDANLRLLELKHGRIDLVQNGISATLLDAAATDKKLVIDQTPSVNVAYLGFQLKDPILAKPDVRRAIAHAIDRDALIEHVLKRTVEKADSPLSPKNWAHAVDLSLPTFDPDTAKRLLDQAGFPDPDGDGPKTRFHLSYKTSTQKDRIEMALLIADYLKAIGISVTVESKEFGTFFRDIREGRMQLYSLTWVGLADPDALTAMFHSEQTPPKGMNRGFYRASIVDHALETARTTYDLTTRRSLYARAQQTLTEDIPQLWLWYENNVVVRNCTILNYTARPNASFRNVDQITRGDCEKNKGRGIDKSPLPPFVKGGKIR